MTHAHGSASIPWLGATLALALAVAYVLLARRHGRRRRTAWPRRRTASLLAGCALLGLALCPPLGPAPTNFPAHTVQHVLIGMLAPLLFVLADPLRLALHTSRPAAVRWVIRLTENRATRVLTHPFTGLTFSVGGLYLLYFTPLYQATMHSALLHHVTNAHFLVSGYLFAWAIAGRTLAGPQPSVTTRIVAIACAVTAHAALAQLLYAGLGHVPVAPVQLRAGATVMYYGGDLAELLLVTALLARIPTSRNRRSSDAGRRSLRAAGRRSLRSVR